MIITEKVRKEFGKTVAVECLDLEVPAGEIYGIIGPNGAGKTTLLRILATLDRPTYGRAFVDGVDVAEDPQRVHHLVGFMPDFYSLYDEMGVLEYLDFFARASGTLHGNERTGRTKETLGLVGLSAKAKAKVAHLSRGMKQRLCLARALIHDPKVLLLDEPASGLDPRARIDLRNLLRNLRDEGKTLLVSSHILTELADFCTGVAIIEKGILLEAGPVAEILSKLKGGTRLRIEVGTDPQGAREILGRLHGVNGIEVDGRSIQCQVDATQVDLAVVNRELVMGGVDVLEFSREKGDLEYIFLQISGNETA